MKDIELSPVAQVRLWSDEVPLPAYSVKGVLSESTSPGTDVTVVHEAICIEALVGRGARSDYGLLALSFKPRAQEMLNLEVPFTEMHGTKWSGALAAKVDDVRIGLPPEYAAPLLSELVVGATNCLPAGTLTISRAAHGMIGSSQNFFRRMVRAALRVMQQDGLDEESLVSALTEVLVRGGKVN